MYGCILLSLKTADFSKRSFWHFKLRQNSQIHISRHYFLHLRFRSIHVRRTNERSFEILLQSDTPPSSPYRLSLTLIIPVPFSHSSLTSYVSVSLKSEVTYVFVYRAHCKGAAAFHLNTASLNKRGVVYLSLAGSKGWLLCVKARHDLA
jgi:hypothetical protein